jgi:hypothetical protein
VAEILGFTEASRVGLPLARRLGLTEHFLRAHSRFVPPDPRASTAPMPDPATGKLFDGKWQSRMSGRNRVAKAPTWLLGELLESWAKRGTAIDLPATGILLSAAANIVGKPRTTLISIVAARKFPARHCTFIKRNGKAERTRYLTDDDLRLVPDYDAPGHRLFPIGDRWWCPLLEAARWACVNQDDIRRWTPKKHGGKGCVCRPLGEGLTCQRLKVPARGGEGLLVYDISELLIIEQWQNKRPIPLPAPAAPKTARDEPPKPKRGPKPKRFTQPQRDRILDDWDRASAAGESQKDFCKRYTIDGRKVDLKPLRNMVSARSMRRARGG